MSAPKRARAPRDLGDPQDRARIVGDVAGALAPHAPPAVTERGRGEALFMLGRILLKKGEVPTAEQARDLAAWTRETAAALEALADQGDEAVADATRTGHARLARRHAPGDFVTARDLAPQAPPARPRSRAQRPAPG